MYTVPVLEDVLGDGVAAVQWGGEHKANLALLNHI